MGCIITDENNKTHFFRFRSSIISVIVLWSINYIHIFHFIRLNNFLENDDTSKEFKNIIPRRKNFTLSLEIPFKTIKYARINKSFCDITV